MRLPASFAYSLIFLARRKNSDDTTTYERNALRFPLRPSSEQKQGISFCWKSRARSPSPPVQPGRALQTVQPVGKAPDGRRHFPSFDLLLWASTSDWNYHRDSRFNGG